MLIHPASDKDIFFHDRVERKDPMSSAKDASYDYCIQTGFKIAIYVEHTVMMALCNQTTNIVQLL